MQLKQESYHTLYRLITLDGYEMNGLTFNRLVQSVIDYYTRLTQLAMQIGRVDETNFLDKFIRGLKSKTRMEVELYDPQSLQEAVRLADRYDSIVYQQAHIASQQPFKSSYQKDVCGEPMQLDVLYTTQNSNTTDTIQVDALKTKTPSLKFKKLSDKERAYLRSINVHFKYRKLGHMVQECPTQLNDTKSGNQKYQ